MSGGVTIKGDCLGAFFRKKARGFDTVRRDASGLSRMNAQLMRVPEERSSNVMTKSNKSPLDQCQTIHHRNLEETSHGQHR